MKSRRSHSTKHHPATVSDAPRKRKRVEDTAYHPSREKQKSKKQATVKNNVLAMRTDNRESFIDPENGIVVPLKTAVMVHWSEIESACPDQAKKLFSPKAKQIRSNRPIADMADFSPSGKPRTIFTPGKTALTRSSSLHAVSLFTNLPSFNLSESEKIEIPEKVKKEFFSSQQYHAICKIQNTIKRNEVRITPTLLDETAEERKENSFKRAVSQNKVMVEKGVDAKHGSATRYAQEAFNLNETVNNIKWEWMHLVAHFILGDISQNKENLAIGTDFSNSEMALVEAQLKPLAKRYPDGFNLRVSAELIPGTHLASTIKYDIETPNFTIPLIFKAQTTTKPHFVLGQHVKDLLDSLHEAAHSPLPSSPKK